VLNCVFGGLFVRRERWGLSIKGKLVAFVLAALAVWGLVWGAYDFLAVNNGGTGEVMVVEGWIGGRQIDNAAEAFKRGRYKCVVVVRDIYAEGNKWSTGSWKADYVAADLVKQGVPEEVVHALFCSVVRRDRTYHCALAARQWLSEQGMAVGTIDVVTCATHARRSRLLFEKAFGSGVKIGVIAIEDPSYDPDRWWASSAGVRDVVGEMVAYLYARLLFWPGSGERGTIDHRPWTIDHRP